MLKKCNRLTSTYEFNKVRRYGKKYTATLFHIFYLNPKGYEGPPKIGIVVSNKFHKAAVRRNRVKRVFREVVYNNLGKIKQNLWIVIHPKVLTLDKNYEEVNADFVKALQKIPIST